MIFSFTRPLLFADLPLWEQESFEDLLIPFKKTWETFVKKPSLCEAPFQKNMLSIASLFLKNLPQSPDELKIFFETYFCPFASAEERLGLLTGYHEITIRGSRTFSSQYSVPLYRPPSDLLFIPDLGIYNPPLKGQKWAGKKGVNGDIIPYHTRLEIMQGVLKETPFLWLSDPLEAYFLHVQGSGRILLEDNSVVRVGYKATNGHPYVSLGKTLQKLGILTQDLLTKDALETYLRTLPLREGKGGLYEILALNSSYIFFEEMKDLSETEGPRGSFGGEITLTPFRSLAVDPLYTPLGFPVWINAFNLTREIKEFFPRLTLAQDIGSAIKGPKRGDLFWGSDKRSEEYAGLLNNPCEMILFLPKEYS